VGSPKSKRPLSRAASFHSNDTRCIGARLFPHLLLGHSPRAILDELSRIMAADVVLPLADGSQNDLRIRCVMRPDPGQALLIDRLGLDLPRRLRMPLTIEMQCQPRTLSY
jgi:hypothetical protein